MGYIMVVLQQRIKIKPKVKMKPSESIKPISYLKTHASEIVRNLSETQQTYVITQNGEAKAVLQDIHTYEETQDTLALLKILALSSKGESKPLEETFADLRKQIDEEFYS